MGTIQDQLANGISSQYANAVVKKVNKDNYLDIHLPALNPAKGTHLFFNTSKNTIKVGFYCRDEEFLAPILAANPTLEAYSQGIRLAGNTPFDTVEEALDGASTLINAFSAESSQTSPVKEKICRYFPDFIVEMLEDNGKIQKYVIEIKPKRQTLPPVQGKKKNKTYINEVNTYAVNQSKWKSIVEWCEDRMVKFKVITEKDLF